MNPPDVPPFLQERRHIIEKYMKFAVDAAHRAFFQDHLAIEFEDFFSSEQVEQWRQWLKEALGERLSGPVEKASSAEIFMKGHDLIREILRTQAKLADIAADLMQTRIIRLGYTQYLPSPPAHLDKLDQAHPYFHLLQKREATLESVSSIQGLLCGVMICLQDGDSKSSVFPSRAGNVVYFNPTVLLDYSLGKGEYFLIVYVREHALYIYNSEDPHTNHLKKWGYTFAEPLNNKYHPIVKR